MKTYSRAILLLAGSAIMLLQGGCRYEYTDSVRLDNTHYLFSDPGTSKRALFSIAHTSFLGADATGFYSIVISNKRPRNGWDAGMIYRTATPWRQLSEWAPHANALPVIRAMFPQQEHNADGPVLWILGTHPVIIAVGESPASKIHIKPGSVLADRWVFLGQRFRFAAEENLEERITVVHVCNPWEELQNIPFERWQETLPDIVKRHREQLTFGDDSTVRTVLEYFRSSSVRENASKLPHGFEK
jgi:hypothetical protein